MDDKVQNQIYDLLGELGDGHKPLGEESVLGEGATNSQKDLNTSADEEDDLEFIKKRLSEPEKTGQRDNVYKDEKKTIRNEAQEKQQEMADKFSALYGGKMKSGRGEDGRNTLDKLIQHSDLREQQLEEKIGEIDQNRREEELRNRAIAVGLGYINLKGLPIMPEALRIVDESESREKGIICFMYKAGAEIRLATLRNDGQLRKTAEELSAEHGGVRVSIYLTSESSLHAALKMYAALPKIIENVDEVKVLERDVERAGVRVADLKSIGAELQNISTTEVFSLIIASAVKVESSDIHIEAEEHRIKVRFRIDGVLHDIAEIGFEAWKYLISRIKLNARLKINVTDKPQDGRYAVHIKGQEIDFRVSTIPTVYGESVVMRILYHDKIEKMNLDNLGIDEYDRQILMGEIKRPNGLVVVTGPTGAGKTTTLYAVLNQLNTADNKIITIEDPIEYKIEGINQSEINEGRGYVFAKALRSIVRQDPDIILVGEIRDKETAEIALSAALTGHLVFTTLHTNDAAGAAPRFLALGAKPYLVSPALNVVVAQRLVRRVCEGCKERVEESPENIERARREIENLPEKFKLQQRGDLSRFEFYHGKGCAVCAGLGYKGQIGIFEIFQITDEVKEMILSSQIADQVMREAARKNGMVSIAQDGVLKAMRGVTTLSEVFRVT